MLELKALLLTQGMHGMISQVEGLAKALDLSYKHQKINLILASLNIYLQAWFQLLQGKDLQLNIL